MTPETQKKYQCLLVDWDGTAQHTLPIWLKATMQQLALRNISLEAQLVAQKILPNLDHCTEHGVTDTDCFIRNTVAEAILSLHGASLNQELWQMLARLKQAGIIQAVVTNSSQEMVDKALAYQNQTPFFDHLVTGDIPELKQKRKPQPEPILYALALLGSAPKSAVILGDSSADLQAGLSAGVDTIWWYPPENEQYYNYQEMLTFQPTYIARNSQEVWEIVRQGK